MTVPTLATPASKPLHILNIDEMSNNIPNIDALSLGAEDGAEPNSLGSGGSPTTWNSLPPDLRHEILIARAQCTKEDRLVNKLFCEDISGSFDSLTLERAALERGLGRSKLSRFTALKKISINATTTPNGPAATTSPPLTRRQLLPFLAASCELQNLESLQLSCGEGIKSIASDISSLLQASSSNLSKLERLSLARCNIDDDGIQVISGLIQSATHLSSLRTLDLQDNMYGDDGAFALLGALSSATHMANLTSLHLSGGLSADVATALLAACRLPHLKGLQLESLACEGESSRVETAGSIRALCQQLRSCTVSSHLSNLTSLSLSAVGLSKPSISVLGSTLKSCAYLSSLRRLVLANVALRGPSATSFFQALTKSTHLVNIEELDFSYNYMLPDDIYPVGYCLMRSPHLASLKSLNMSGNNLRERASAAFTCS